MATDKIAQRVLEIRARARRLTNKAEKHARELLPTYAKIHADVSAEMGLVSREHELRLRGALEQFEDVIKTVYGQAVLDILLLLHQEAQ